MKFILKPSLEHIACVKIVITLWRQNYIWNSIENYLHSHYENTEWETIENSVEESVSHLSLPELLKKKVSAFIKPIGIQILKWITYHCIHHPFPLDLGTKFCWTPYGTIDSKKTAEVIFNDDNLDICMRYRLACLYCMKSDILKLWNKIPMDTKMYYFDEYSLYKGHLYQGTMLVYWNTLNRGQRNDITNYHQFQFEFSVDDGNKEAVYYFLQKLTTEEKEFFLGRTIENVQDPDLFIFLLSQMNVEDQAELFKQQSSRVLMCFLDWPFQSFFVEIANIMMDFMSSKDIQVLLDYFAHKKSERYNDYNYEKLFESFLQNSSKAVKSHVISYFTKFQSKPNLYLIQNKKNLKVLLQDASVTEKRNLFYDCLGGKIICRNLIYEEEWDILRFFIEECLKSKFEVMKFKKKIERDLNFDYFLMTKKHKWDELFLLPVGEGKPPKKIHRT